MSRFNSCSNWTHARKINQVLSSDQNMAETQFSILKTKIPWQIHRIEQYVMNSNLEAYQILHPKNKLKDILVYLMMFFHFWSGYLE